MNDEGWIITYARRVVPEEPPVIQHWAVLLTPLPECREELTGDNCVDGDDYDEVINHILGGCTPGVICIWDIDGDCDVDLDDVDLVLDMYLYCANSENLHTCCTGCYGFSGFDAQTALADLIARVLASNNSSEVQSQLISQLLDRFSQFGE